MANAYHADSPVDPQTTDTAAQPAATRLLSFLDVPNLATTLDEAKLSEISHKALEGYRLDDASRDDWKKRNTAGMELATLIAGEEKDYPFKNASNVKYPLITVGALQFNARAYPAIIQGDRVAKCKVNGHDEDGSKAKRAERVSEHMSWQLTSEMPEWEEDTDRLLLMVAITGAVFRKRYYDPTLGRQCSRLVPASRLVMNYQSRSLADTPRVSEELSLYPYEIEERIRDGRFVEFDYGQAQANPNDPNDKTNSNDPDAPHLFIEQHRLLDLDEDNYPEPYIVTIHVQSEQVCRIVPNFDKDSVRVTADGKIAAIRKRDYYTKYLFFPSPDGGAYGMGLGSLLGSTNEAINTTLNQMLDAGHMANIQSGFVSAVAGIREKTISLERGKFKVLNTAVPINQAIMPMQFKGPDETLFKLLGLLIEQGKEVSSTKDVLTGDTGGKVMAPTTTLALIEQGMKVFNAIFKRIHLAVKNELVMHAKLNYEHLTAEEYNAFWDDPNEQFDPKADYDLADMNVTPVSDPSVSTQMQKLAKSQIISEIAAQNPMVNQLEATKRRLEAAEVEDIDKLLVPPPQPDPKMQAFTEAMQSMSLLELKAKIEKMETASILDLANAEAAEAGQQLSFYDQFLESLKAQHGMEMDNAQIPGGPGSVPGMAGAPGDQMGAGPDGGAGLGDSSPDAGPALGAAAAPPSAVATEPAGSGAPQGPG